MSVHAATSPHMSSIKEVEQHQAPTRPLAESVARGSTASSYSICLEHVAAETWRHFLDGLLLLLQTFGRSTRDGWTEDSVAQICEALQSKRRRCQLGADCSEQNPIACQIQLTPLLPRKKQQLRASRHVTRNDHPIQTC